MGPDQTRRQGEPEGGGDATTRPRMVTLRQAVAAIQESLLTTPGQETVAVDIGVEFLTQAPNGAPLPQLMAFVAAPGEAVATVRIELKSRQYSPYAGSFPPPPGNPSVWGTRSDPESGPPPVPSPYPGPGRPPSNPVSNPNRPNLDRWGHTPPGPSADDEDDDL